VSKPVGNPARNRLIGLAVAVLAMGIDRYVKELMIAIRLRRDGPIEILSFFDLRWTENYGVSLGLLTAESPEMRWGLVAMTSLIALVVLIWMMREKLLGETAALGLVLGGAIGNIYDRTTYGYVIDYADLHFGTFRPFMIFNIADAAITIGVLIILARSLLSREKPDKAAAEPAPES
jgi:signal peptidase II